MRNRRDSRGRIYDPRCSDNEAHIALLRLNECPLKVVFGQHFAKPYDPRRVGCHIDQIVSDAVASLRGQAADTLVILHTSDTHAVFAPGRYRPLLEASFTGRRWSADSLARFFETVPRRERADAVVITGDLLACYEGETPSGEMLAFQIEQFRPLYDRCPVPLLLALGNHDISSYRAAPGDSGIITSQTAAVRARAAGFDGLDIHCAHGYLVPSFFSPLTNQRMDEYGGDLAGRTRFLLETIRGIKSELGNGFPLTIKISGDEYIEGGLGIWWEELDEGVSVPTLLGLPHH